MEEIETKEAHQIKEDKPILLQDAFKEDSKNVLGIHRSSYRYLPVTRQAYHIDFFSFDQCNIMLKPVNYVGEMYAKCNNQFEKMKDLKNLTFEQFEEVRDKFLEPFKNYIDDYDFNGYLSDICHSEMNDIILIDASSLCNGQHAANGLNAYQWFEEEPKSLNDGYDSATSISYLKVVEMATENFLKHRRKPTRYTNFIQQILKKGKGSDSDDYAKNLFLSVSYVVEEYKAAVAVQAYKNVICKLFPITTYSTTPTFSSINLAMATILNNNAMHSIISSLNNFHIFTDIDSISKQADVIASRKEALDITDSAFDRVKNTLQEFQDLYGNNTIETWIAFMMVNHIEKLVTKLDLMTIVKGINPDFINYLTADWVEFAKLMSDKSLTELVSEISEILGQWKKNEEIKTHLKFTVRPSTSGKLDPDGLLYNEFNKINGIQVVPKTKLPLTTAKVNRDEINNNKNTNKNGNGGNDADADDGKDMKYENNLLNKLCEMIETKKLSKAGLQDKMWELYAGNKLSNSVQKRVEYLVNNGLIYHKIKKTSTNTMTTVELPENKTSKTKPNPNTNPNPDHYPIIRVKTKPKAKAAKKVQISTISRVKKRRA